MLYAASQGVSYDSTLTLGRQYCFINRSQLGEILGRYDAGCTPRAVDELDSAINATVPTPGGISLPYSEPLFRYLGARVVDSIDYSDYEGATVLHDLNLPVGHELKNKYSCVWDGGLLEHVFNYPTAVKNCMDMTAIGGWLILSTPTNNWMGHGFYQFSPELFFSLLREENGFSDAAVFMAHRGRWYECVNPRKLGRRAELGSPFADRDAILLHVMARKIASVPTTLTVMQSDYETAWAKGAAGGFSSQPQAEHKEEAKAVSLGTRIRRAVPESVKRPLRPLYLRLRRAVLDTKVIIPRDDINSVRKGG
jgi:hypothetical protein